MLDETDMLDTEYFDCQCHSEEHTLRFVLSLEDDEYSKPEIYTSVFLNPPSSTWKRLWISIKYIFGYKCKYGHWDTFIMRPNDAIRLRIMLDKLIETHTAPCDQETCKHSLEDLKKTLNVPFKLKIF
jgi:hypothetical protein